MASGGLKPSHGAGAGFAPALASTGKLLTALVCAIAAVHAVAEPAAAQTDDTATPVEIPQAVPLLNPSFEHDGRRNRATSWEQIAGWDSVTTGNSGVLRHAPAAPAAPVDGEWVAFQEGSGERVTQTTGHRLVAGATYTLRLWARSINRIGNTAETVVEAGLAAGGTELTVRQVAVNPARLQGAPLTEPNDDGGNVWIDGDRRHQFADIHLYQELDADPLRDPWHASWSDYAAYDRFEAWAVGPILFPGGKWVYGVHYDEHAPDVYSEIRFMKAEGAGDPAYRWSWPPTTVLFHVGDEDPWVIDPHLTWDESSERLWLAWGGGTLWVSELNPDTGTLLADPVDKEFDAHPESRAGGTVGWRRLVDRLGRGARAVPSRRLLVPVRQLRQSFAQLHDPRRPRPRSHRPVLRQAGRGPHRTRSLHRHLRQYHHLGHGGRSLQPRPPARVGRERHLSTWATTTATPTTCHSPTALPSAACNGATTGR